MQTNFFKQPIPWPESRHDESRQKRDPGLILEDALFFRLMFQDILCEYSYDDVPDEFKVDFNGKLVPAVRPKKSAVSASTDKSDAPVKMKYASEYNRWKKMQGFSHFSAITFDHPLMWEQIVSEVYSSYFDGVLMTTIRMQFLSGVIVREHWLMGTQINRGKEVVENALRGHIAYMYFWKKQYHGSRSFTTRKIL